jgi:putative membrane protein
MWRRRKPNYAKGALAGLAGGLIASYAMNQFQAAVSKVKESQKSGARETPSGSYQEQPENQQHETEEEASTVKVAVAVSHAVLDRDLGPEEKEKAGNAVHYAFGGLVGSVYGMVSEAVPLARSGLGTTFGTVLWLLSDEVAVPALGLSRLPNEYGMEIHTEALASHLVYGITTELVRRALRAV